MKVAWIDARHPMINQQLWGLTLLERNVRELEKLGFTRITIASLKELDPLAHFCHPAPPSLTITVVCEESKPFDSLVEQLAREKRVLVLEGHALNDRRVLRKLMDAPSPCAIVSPSGSNAAAAAVLSLPNASLLQNRRTPLTEFLSEALTHAQITPLDVSTFRAYIENLRREIAPFLLRVETAQQLNEADDLLRRTAHKGVLEFVAKYIHPPIEFGTVKLIAHTPITPNLITIIWLILAGLAVPLFATGHLLWGCILAAISGILDGVDGKLARLTLRFSKTGDRLDHIGGALFDAIWYLALGWYFVGGDLRSTGAVFAAILVLSYSVERSVPGIFRKVHHAEIHDYEPIDIVVRLIGSRMNNNIWVFMLGVILGFPRETFYGISLWMLATATWHTIRLVHVSLRTGLARSSE